MHLPMLKALQGYKVNVVSKVLSESAFREICKLCKCQPDTKTIDCQDLEIDKMFTEKEFVALNSSKVPQDIFRLNNNRLTEIPSFPVLSIKVLNLHRNHINKIENLAFYNLTLLEELDLSSNSLTTSALIPEVFAGHFSPSTYQPLENLKVLRLSHNDIHSLHDDLFEHMPVLEVLSLDYNPIMTIDHLTAIAISSISNLKFLDMSYMELKEIPTSLFNYPRDLQTLNLTGNLLTKIPDALDYTPNLETLYLDENDIQWIGADDGVFPALKKLKLLSLSYTTLKSIGEGAFSKLTALTTLMVTNNHHLSVIHENALSRKGEEDPRRLEYPPLKNLYLHNNNLTTLHSNMFPSYTTLDIVDIRFNPWICDCENQWIISNLLPLIIKKHPTMNRDIVCNEPIALVGMELNDLLHQDRKLRCLDKFNHTPQNDGTILVGILIGKANWILIGIPMALAIVFVYKRGCFGLSDNRGAAAYSRAFYKRAEAGDDFHI
ncbi:Leucine-rich repeat neuronal protein 1 [Pseudolycoriella hygida]|uniref:Leucine-rich repeat neuronal protein 1 n=1 Tax=Pseudolycoriella hygida TaxID=35572 RepID=A0A9Q0ND23_9DIPT|nr:Leucine-rich repeat neuronal protein 1 [Pseudolycoriella hygida]